MVFHFSLGDHNGTLRIERVGDSAKITMLGLSGENRAERVVPFRQQPLSEHIVGNMMSTATDEEFFRAVRFSQLVDRALKA